MGSQLSASLVRQFRGSQGKRLVYGWNNEEVFSSCFLSAGILSEIVKDQTLKSSLVDILVDAVDCPQMNWSDFALGLALSRVWKPSLISLKRKLMESSHGMVLAGLSLGLCRLKCRVRELEAALSEHLGSENACDSFTVISGFLLQVLDSMGDSKRKRTVQTLFNKHRNVAAKTALKGVFEIAFNEFLASINEPAAPVHSGKKDWSLVDFAGTVPLIFPQKESSSFFQTTNESLKSQLLDELAKDLDPKKPQQLLVIASLLSVELEKNKSVGDGVGAESIIEPQEMKLDDLFLVKIAISKIQNKDENSMEWIRVLERSKVLPPFDWTSTIREMPNCAAFALNHLKRKTATGSVISTSLSQYLLGCVERICSGQADAGLVLLSRRLPELVEAQNDPRNLVEQLARYVVEQGSRQEASRAGAEQTVLRNVVSGLFHRLHPQIESSKCTKMLEQWARFNAPLFLQAVQSKCTVDELERLCPTGRPLIWALGCLYDKLSLLDAVKQICASLQNSREPLHPVAVAALSTIFSKQRQPSVLVTLLDSYLLSSKNDSILLLIKIACVQWAPFDSSALLMSGGQMPLIADLDGDIVVQELASDDPLLCGGNWLFCVSSFLTSADCSDKLAKRLKQLLLAQKMKK